MNSFFPSYYYSLERPPILHFCLNYCVFVNGEHLSDADMIRQGWADYFKTLATLIENENFDEEYNAHIELRKHLIQNLCENDKTETDISSAQ